MMDMNEKETAKAEPKKSSSFIVQGTILALSGIISSLIGLAYRIPLTRIIGDAGNGYYSAAFNVYTIILLLSSYSLPLAVSKMVSARVGNGQYLNAKRILTASVLYATLVGAAGCAIIWFGSAWFSDYFLHIPDSRYALRALAPTVWIVSYLGVLRGYYQGHATMVPTAVSQIIEQIVNALVSVGAAYYLFRFAENAYRNADLSSAYGAMGGTIGTGAGAGAALVMFLILFACGRKTRRKNLAADGTRVPETYAEITRVLFFTVVPVILSTAIYNLDGIVDNAIFGQSMYAAGQAAKTAADYGIYTGKYKLLINVPISIANSLSSSLIPTLSRASAARNRGQVESSVSKAIRFAMIVAIPAAVGMAVLADPIITLLFGRSAKAVTMMTVGSAGVIFYSLSTITNGILQGTSHMRIPVRHAVISLAVHVTVLIFLLQVLHLGIFGVVAADIIFAFCMCVLNALSIRRLLSYRQEIRRTYLGPAFCALLMGAGTWFLYRGLHRLLTGKPLAVLISTLISVLFAVALYASLLIRSGCVTEYELTFFPGGRKLVRLAKKLRLLR